MAVECRGSVEVPVGVRGEVHPGRRIGGGGDAQLYGVVGDQRITRRDGTVAGETAGAVRQAQRQHSLGFGHLVDLPVLRMGAGGAGMERPAALVLLQLEDTAAERRATIGDAVGDRTDDGPEIVERPLIGGDVRTADGQAVGNAGQAQIVQDRAAGQQDKGEAAVRQRDALDRRTVKQAAGRGHPGRVVELILHRALRLRWSVGRILGDG